MGGGFDTLAPRADSSKNAVWEQLDAPAIDPHFPHAWNKLSKEKVLLLSQPLPA